MSVDRKSILFIVTSHDELGLTGKRTGWYLPEVAHPYNILKQYYHITVASPKGGKTPMDPASAEAFKDDEECKAFLADEAALGQINSSIPLNQVNPSEYIAVVYPGGHGPMWDLVDDILSQTICRSIYEEGGLVASVCHGPAAIVNVKLSNGDYMIRGKTITGFSNTEEDAVQLTSFMPFLLEDSIKANGGIYVKADEPWGVKVVVDGQIITGQNPASASGIAVALHELLSK